jgi:TonB family protein
MAMKKILVIDYDQSTLATLSGVLAKEGYAVVTAGDGQAGWDKYNKESPDLVLMEAMLPKVHGFELCQRITSERNSQATVFIMTGVYKDRVYRTEALRTYGASEYFEKPLKMAEILASIQAVLGKPEPRPEPEPTPVLEARAAPVMAEPRKREKPRSDDEIFSLPADLDQLTRDIPRVKKPAPARRESPAETRFESLADDLLRSVVVDRALQKKPAERTNGGNGNGNDGPDIDQFLKSALAGLDLSSEKVKAPKSAPPQPPVTEKPVIEDPVVEKPVVAKPAVEKPIIERPLIEKLAPERPLAANPVIDKPFIEKPAVEKPKPVHTLPDSAFTVPDMPAKKSTLTPGDPGSDISPFFQPGKPKLEARAEVPRFQAPPPPPVVPAPSRTPRPAERTIPEPVKREPTKPEPVKHEPVRREPIKTEPVRREPAKSEVKIPEISITASGDIFQKRDIFEHVAEEKPKKGFPTLIAVTVGVAAVAVAAFLFLRPKPAPKTDETFRAAQAVTEQAPPAQPIVEAPPPEIKVEPVKPKPKPAAKKAQPEPEVAEGILVPADPAAVLSLSDNKAEAPPVKTEETAPPAKTEAEPPPSTAAGTSTDPDPGLTVSAPAAGPPAKEGDLVDLGSVTSPPTLLKRINPIYPQVAQQLGIEGTITVNALIDEKGNVIDTGVLKGIKDDKGLGKAAEASVRKWKFEPARKDGVAVKVWKSFLIAFKAEKTGSGASE